MKYRFFKNLAIAVLTQMFFTAALLQAGDRSKPFVFIDATELIMNSIRHSNSNMRPKYFDSKVSIGASYGSSSNYTMKDLTTKNLGSLHYAKSSSIYSSFYCAAACEKALGGIDSLNVVGARSNTQVEAAYLAKRAAIDQLNCRYAVRVLACAGDEEGGVASALSSCQFPNGNTNSQTIGFGRGLNEVEAYVESLSSVISSYKCQYGVSLTQSSWDENPNVCESYCLKPNGRLSDNKFSVARGQGILEAIFLSQKSLKQEYNCQYGVSTENCQQTQP